MEAKVLLLNLLLAHVKSKFKGVCVCVCVLTGGIEENIAN